MSRMSRSDCACIEKWKQLVRRSLLFVGGINIDNDAGLPDKIKNLSYTITSSEKKLFSFEKMVSCQSRTFITLCIAMRGARHN